MILCARYQTLVMMRRTFFVFIKNPAIYWARIAMYFMLALMMGTLFFQISNSQDVRCANVAGYTGA
jgi:hypothetical protein